MISSIQVKAMKQNQIKEALVQFGVDDEFSKSILSNSHGIYYRFLSALNYGRSNAVHMNEMAILLDADNRTVRNAAECFRRHGLPIIADTAGYYLSQDTEVLCAYYRTAKARAMTCLTCLNSVRQFLKRKGEPV